MIILLLVLGLIMGSFFNVCIYRIPREESICYPPSRCSNCSFTLRIRDIIPLLSYMYLRGRCRYCDEKISLTYPIIEVTTALVYMILYYKFSLSIEFFKYSFLWSILMVSAIIDYRTQYVYESISKVGFIGGIFFSLINLIYGGRIDHILLSLIIPLVFLGGIILLTRKIEALGLGDLELFIIAALYLSPTTMVVALFLSVVLGGIIAMAYLLKGYKRKSIAFVPYIALGTFLALIFEEKIIRWYFTITL